MMGGHHRPRPPRVPPPFGSPISDPPSRHSQANRRTALLVAATITQHGRNMTSSEKYEQTVDLADHFLGWLDEEMEL